MSVDHQSMRNQADRSLATSMIDLGFDQWRDVALSQLSSFQRAFRLLPLRGISEEKAVAEVLGAMARCAGCEIIQRGLSPAAQCTSGSPLIWGEDVDELRLMRPGLDWPRVADLLDHDGFVVDATGFSLLAALYRRGAGHQLPISSFLSYLWKNIPGQISMIQGSVSCLPEVYSFAAGRVLSLEGLEGLSGIVTPWISLDLLQMLCVLTENDHYSSVRAILEFPVKSYPEILLLGFVQCSTPGEWGILQREVFGSLFPVFLDNFASPNSTTVLRRVWLLSQALLLEILVQYYSHDARLSLPRIIDICQDLGALSAVLDSTPFIFSIDVACAALSRCLFDLSSWLQNKISGANPLLFLQSLIRFLDQKLPSEGEAMGQISLEAATSCLMVLHQSISAGAVPSEVISEVKRVQLQAVQFFPSLASMPPAPDQFASDVEEEANRYFRSIYAENKPIAEVVEALARYKDSSVVREQEVFACMINNLFDEYRFFPRYPDKELHITATLFGAMIQKQLISSLTLGVALRYVLDALGKPLGSKMSTFGLDALAQFRQSLPLWPQFCAELLQTPLKDADPELRTRLENIVSCQSGDAPPPATEAKPKDEPDLSVTKVGGPGPASSSVDSAAQLPSNIMDSIDAMDDKEGSYLAAQVANSSLLPSKDGKEAPSLAALVNTESLESAAEKYKDFREPPPLAVEKVLFFMNNVTVVNVDIKVVEIKEKIYPDFLAWFANYIVVRRAAQEPNYHGLYISLCDKMNEKELYRLLIRTTLYYTKILLYSERTVKESNDRALLKNLGVWLGLLTFAKNKPVLSKDLELKQLVVEAYKRGRLIAVLPFMQKLLECCKDSKVFKVTNPMIAGILSLLAELHSLKGLKINNAFSIELVFKAFNIQAEDVKPTDILRSLPRERQCNPDWGMEILGSEPENTTPLPGPGDGKGQQQNLQQGLASLALHQQAMGRNALIPQGEAQGKPEIASSLPAGSINLDFLLSTIHPLVVVGPQLAQVADRLQLKMHIPLAMDRAIGEILNPVVERSVTIACYTAVELILKDFSSDPDENRMRKAAHLMVSTLAGSLAMVTSKDPLRVSLTNALKAQLMPAGVAPEMLESILTIIVGDNIDLGCSVIERAATEKATRDVDKLLQPSYDERTLARVHGKPFVDSSSSHGRFPQSLPDSLRPRPGQMSAQLLRVYEDFSRIPKTLSASLSVPGTHPGGIEGMFMDRFSQWQSRADSIIARDADGASQPSDQSALQHLLQELSANVNEVGPVNAEELAVLLARRVVKHLSEQGTKLHMTFYVASLEALALACTGSSSAGGKRLSDELSKIVLEEDIKVSKEVIEMLIRARLLSLPELDASVLKLLSSPSGSRVQQSSELLMHLIKTCLLNRDGQGQATLMMQDLPKSMELLTSLASRNPLGNDAIIQSVDQARKASLLAGVANRSSSEVPAPVRDKANDPPGLREQAISQFDEWLRLLSANSSEEKTLSSFLVNLKNAGLLDLDDTTDRFFRLLIELCINHSLSGLEVNGRPDFLAQLLCVTIDGLVKLVLSIVHIGAGESFFLRFLALLTAVIKRDADERGTLFNSRPFLRLFVGLATEAGAGPADVHSYRLLKAIGVALYSLQPISVPGFAYAYVEAISHRSLMPRLLLSPPGSQGVALFESLLLSLLKFLEPYLRTSALMTDGMKTLYKASLRLMLVLLHDFPEFLCERHHTLCDAIPPPCVQLRNLVLSAFPKEMRLPDPFTLTLKVELLPEMQLAPRSASEPDRLIPLEPVRLQVDHFLKTRQPPSLPTELVKRFFLIPSADGKGGTLNPSAIHALALYVGSSMIAKQGAAAAQASINSPVGVSPVIELFLRLLTEMDNDGRYLLINAMANQLRYPNSHTHFYQSLLLAVFFEVKADNIREQITRVLLERLIVSRPHPWGLLVTFVELLRNTKYNFWQGHEFVHCSPEIERLFKSVTSSVCKDEMVAAR